MQCAKKAYCRDMRHVQHKKAWKQKKVFAKFIKTIVDYTRWNKKTKNGRIKRIFETAENLKYVITFFIVHKDHKSRNMLQICSANFVFPSPITHIRFITAMLLL